ncbi:uncharacterized protein LOC128272913 [Anopheles cruzii]|uniref:uncharacterized protein LOC128272913 n=1 Tax=Anopheles cruzii TaxID=68878 RepID=UPI0022EC4832|nr:uncharacterized protein LOC128272913 [Anopheles cruzii]
MVICTYFLNSNCRFGSRCNNEHIDICALVKNEVEVTLKGNQWPLSTFGPFKDRCSIPTFIEDRSFEEIRMLYLEAKMQNNLPAHEMQLGQMINDAKAKLQWLATMNRDILSTLVELYNQQEPSTKPVGAAANPFASVGSFGANTTAASNIFGGSTGTGNSFGTGFGGSANVATPSTGNIFGGPITGQAVPSTGNIFGVASTAPKPNIFGAAAQSQQQSQISSGGNIFGMQQPAQHSGNSVFGGPATMSGGLGMFGGVQQPPAQITSSIFGSVPPPNPNAAATGGNIFGHSPAQIAPGFGQQSSNAFGMGASGNLFSSNSTSAGFGTLSKPQHTGSVFNSVSFGAPTATSPFVQPQGQSMPGAASISSQSLFLPAPTAASSIGSNAFGAPTPVQPALAPQSATMYSKIEDIPAEIVSAYNADQFQLGRIPSVPPPKELCH